MTEPEAIFDDYQDWTDSLVRYEGDDKTKLAYTALGLAEEAGEVAGKVKRVFRGDFDLASAKQQIELELGDCLFYLARVARECGLTLSDVATSNVCKLEDRRRRGVLKGSGDSR